MRTRWNATILIACVLACTILSIVTCSDKSGSATALLIIDVQDFYFPCCNWGLVNPEPAALNAKRLLQHFRKTHRLVVHVKHHVDSGGDIHESVKPTSDEKVIVKESANAFKDTELLAFLRSRHVEELVICGMMTHMCVEAAVRAAHDFGFRCTLIGDACATKSLTYEDRTVTAEDVQAATLRTLSGSYAKIMNTEDFINRENE